MYVGISPSLSLSIYIYIYICMPLYQLKRARSCRYVFVVAFYQHLSQRTNGSMEVHGSLFIVILFISFILNVSFNCLLYFFTYPFRFCMFIVNICV